MKSVIIFSKFWLIAIASTLLFSKVLLAQDFGFSQTEDYPYFDRTSINDCAAKSNGEIIIVGNKGLAAWSKDAGASWQKAIINRDVDFKSVIASSDSTLWAITEYSTVLRCTDDYTHWETICSDTSSKSAVLYAFISKNEIIRSVTNKLDGKTKCYKSTDAGLNWGEPIDLGAFYPREIAVIDTANLLIWQNGTTYKVSSNAGNSWESKTLPFYTTGWAVYNQNNYFVLTTDSCLITSDAGHTWERINDYGDSYFKQVLLIDSMNILGVTYDAKLMISGDRGKSWRVIKLDYVSLSTAVLKMASKDVIYLTDVNKQHAISTDRGHSWQYSFNNNIYNEFSLSNAGIAVLDKDYAWTLTQKGLLRTTNAGKSWKLLCSINAFTPYFSYYFPDIKFADKKIGYCIPKNDTLLKTTDGGNSWNIINPKNTGMALHNLCFASSEVGWMVAANSIMKTVDGGNSWTTQLETGSSISYMQFIDNQTGWACGKKLYRTSDGGNSWDSLKYDFSKFHFINSSVGFAYDDNKRIYSTSDGGSSWTQLSQIKNCKSINNIYFYDALCGMVSTSAGFYYTPNADRIYFTEDGGNTFKYYDYDLVHSIYALDKDCYWLFGYNFVRKFYSKRQAYNPPTILFPCKGDTAYSSKIGVINPNNYSATSVKIFPINSEAPDTTTFNFTETNTPVILYDSEMINNSMYGLAAYTYGELGRSDNARVDNFLFYKRCPAATKLISPINHYVVENDSEDFSWQRNPYAEKYTFKLFSDINKKKTILTQVLSDTVLNINTVQYVGQYSDLYWAVQAENESGKGEYSELRALHFNMSSSVESFPKELNIYPNPLIDMLHINSTSNYRIQEVHIIDLSGKTVYTAKYNDLTNMSIDCSAWAPGVYSIRLETSYGKYCKRVVKE